MRRGFTVVETLIAVAALALVVRLLLPGLQEWWYRGKAVEIVEAIRTVEAAARQVRGSTGSIALAGADAGVVPEGLVAALPGGFAFERDDYTLGWRHWTLGPTLAASVDGEAVGTITVSIENPRLQDAFLRFSHPSLWFQAGETFAFLVPEV